MGKTVKKDYQERFYRKRVHSKDLVSFQVAVKETDLWISAKERLEKEARDLVLNSRLQLEGYISAHPDFLSALEPYPHDPFAPPMVREMIECTRTVGVGPMASVAGAIAQHVALGLLRSTDQVIVENGGDVFVRVDRPLTVSIFAGESPLSERIGLRVSARNMPLGICSSSGTVGHSLSLGAADAACIVSASAILADGAATALCNRIQGKRDLKGIASWAKGVKGILGALVILGDQMATWGDMELVAL